MFGISPLLARSELEKRKNWIGGFVLMKGKGGIEERERELSTYLVIQIFK